MRTDLSFITRRYFVRWRADRINGGWCYAWAWLARVHLGPEARLCMVLSKRQRRGHAFVRLGDRYFDAERPRGVTRYDALPCVVRYVGREREFLCDVPPDQFRAKCHPIERRDGRFRDIGIAPWPTEAA